MTQHEQNTDPQEELQVVGASKRKERSLGFRILRVLFRIFFSLFAFLLFLRLILGIPYVQNKVVDGITAFLSSSLNTVIEIEHVDLDFFDKFVLSGVYIEDLQQDTILYAETIKADINAIKLLKSRVEIEDIAFINTRFNLYRNAGQNDFTLQFILDGLSSGKKKKSTRGTRLFMNIRSINFDNLRFGFRNLKQADHLLVLLKKGRIKFSDINFFNKKLDISEINFDQIDARYAKAVFFPVPIDTTVVETVDTIPTVPWEIKVGQFKIENSNLNYDDLRYPITRETALDLRHFDLNDLTILMKDIHIKDYIGRWNLQGVTFKEQRGFTLNRLAANMMVRRDSMAFYDLELVTPDSYLGDTLIFSYDHISDMGDFNNLVYMDGRLNGASLAIKDLLVFAPQLNNNAFFRSNKEEKVLIDGRIYNAVNRLKASDLFLKVGKRMTLRGNFNSFDLTDSDNAFLNLSVDDLRTNMGNLALLLPYFKFNEQSLKLGNLRFKGYYTGFFHEFTTEGDLNTDLGEAKMSMTFKETTKPGSYSGKLSLKNFDLAAWTDNNDFGKITFSSDVEGSGATLQTVNAKIDATIDSFSYKGYKYENIRLDGNFNKKEFDGEMGIEDDNIRFDFIGNINFNDSLPTFDLSSNIQRLRLKRLNLVKEDYVISSIVRLKFTGDNLDNIIGSGEVVNLDITHFLPSNDSIAYHVDSLILRSSIKNGYHSLTLASELFTGSIGGQFKVKNIEKPLLGFIKKNYPAFAKKFNIYQDTSAIQLADSAAYARSTDNYKVEFNIIDTKALTHILDPELDTIKNWAFKGNFNGFRNTLNFSLVAPQFNYGNVRISGINIKSDKLSREGKVSITVTETKIGSNLVIPKIQFDNEIKGDTIQFNTYVSSITDLFKTLNIRGAFFITDKEQFQVSLEPSDLRIADEEWKISGNNFIQFGSGYIHTNNFILSNKSQAIALNSVGDKGLTLDISQLPVAWLRRFVKIRQLDFGGRITANFKSVNIFKVSQDSLIGTIGVDSFLVNDDYYGQLALNASMPNLKEPLKFDLKIEKEAYNSKGEKQQLEVVGKYRPPSAANFFEKENSFNFRASLNNFPFKFAEYFIPGISKVKGYAKGNVIFTGDAKKPRISGLVSLKEAGAMIDYLQTYYRLEDVNVKVSNELFDFQGSKLVDRFGNIARVSGGIEHQNLRNLTLNLAINAPKFLLLDTEKEDNELFYGRGIGAASVQFTGPLDAPNLTVNVTSSKDTWVAIPLSSERNAKAVNYITFVNPTDTSAEEETKKVRISGIDLELELNITPQAEIALIFDEEVGDIMRGRGKGNLKISLTNTGDFTMFGTYEIESGDYLFTYQNFINKPFTVRKGGTISWSGSPYEAQLNIDAYYKGLRTSPYNFILEYLSQADEIELAKRTTDVDLQMALTGPLLKPNIDFNIEFPNVNQQLASYIDSKLRIIKSDKTELNRQVFGLIVLRTFFPADAPFAPTEQLTNLGFNTLSEVLSNQLSLYVTGLLSEIITDVDFISGIEFDFTYQRFTDVDLQNSSLIAPGSSEFQFNVQNRLFNDKFIIGGNFGIENTSTSGTYFTGDFAVEYILTEDGRVKLRFYQRTEPDLTEQRNKTGVGISYRIEFDSFNKGKVTPIRPPREAPLKPELNSPKIEQK